MERRGKVSPAGVYVRICRAQKNGTGIYLTADEVFALAVMDDAASTAAQEYADDEGLCTACFCRRCKCKEGCADG